MAITWKKLAYEDDCLLLSSFDAKGDLLSASADNTLEVLGVGSEGQALVVAPSEASGLVWTAPIPATHAISNHNLEPTYKGDYLRMHLGTGAPILVSPTVLAASLLLDDIGAEAGHNENLIRSNSDSSALEWKTPAEIAGTMALDDIGVPDAGVDFNLQEATDLVVMTVANVAGLPGVGTLKIGQLCFADTEKSLHICTGDTA